MFDAPPTLGSVTERLHFCAAPYSPGARAGVGGGVAEEGEDIEVLGLPVVALDGPLRRIFR